jgi:hypothetical protein
MMKMDIIEIAHLFIQFNLENIKLVIIFIVWKIIEENFTTTLSV